jgi:predicted extracellular nuclease
MRKASLAGLALLILALPATGHPNGGATVRIHDIQGAAHISPLVGQIVVGVTGIVTAKRSNGFYMQEPDAGADTDVATSEGIFVFTSSTPTVNVGDLVGVGGTVAEFRSGGAASTNLTTTEIGSPSLTISVLSTGNALPVPVVIGTGGRIPPAAVIEDDAAGSVETSGVFDPASDGIDFYESLEGMRVQVDDGVVVGSLNGFGELTVVGDGGANAGIRTTRGGVVVQPTDFNPERIILDDAITPLPAVDVADTFPGALVGVLDYSFGNFKLLATSLPPAVPGELTRETTPAAKDGEVAIATFDIDFLDPFDPAERFEALASQIVANLASPDIVAVHGIQDNSGLVDDGVVDASTTYQMLIAAIEAAGGPTYGYRQIDPVDGGDGGASGRNTRVAFLFRTDRGLAFVDRPGGDSTTATAAVSGPGGPELSFSPGRIDPTNPAFAGAQKPLAGEFTFNGLTLFVIVGHFKSKGGDQPLFGRFQPPALSSETQRVAQAQVVHDFVQSLLALDADANVVVLGDLNDFEFSTALTTLAGGVLHSMTETLPQAERYSFVFDGNSQALDHVLVSGSLFVGRPLAYDIVHVGSEFADQVASHDPAVLRIQTAAKPLTALSPAMVWIGLRNSDAVGLRVDLLAEVYVDDVQIGSGALADVPTGSSGFNRALLRAIPLALSGDAEVAAGTELAIRVSARRTCVGGGHASGTVRLWYNGAAIDSGRTRNAGSRFDATIAGVSTDFFLRAGFALSETAGASRTFVDAAVNSLQPCPDRPYTVFGTWQTTLP